MGRDQTQALVFGLLLVGAAVVAAGLIVGEAIKTRTKRQACLQTMNIPLSAIANWTANPRDENACRQANVMIDNWNKECGNALTALPRLPCP
jgi:hypothetical protein